LEGLPAEVTDDMMAVLFQQLRYLSSEYICHFVFFHIQDEPTEFILHVPFYFFAHCMIDFTSQKTGILASKVSGWFQEEQGSRLCNTIRLLKVTWPRLLLMASSLHLVW
jgi:hypothetical protein